MLTKELEREKAKLASLVEQGKTIKTQRLEHQQMGDSLCKFLDSRRKEASEVALEL